jgi:hypothetical protein
MMARAKKAKKVVPQPRSKEVAWHQKSNSPRAHAQSKKPARDPLSPDPSSTIQHPTMAAAATTQPPALSN